MTGSTPPKPPRKRLKSLDEFEPPPWHRASRATDTLSRSKFMILIVISIMIGASIGLVLF